MWRAKSEIMQNNGKKEERLGRREEKGRFPRMFNCILNFLFGEREQLKHLSPKGVQFSVAAHGEQTPQGTHTFCLCNRCNFMVNITVCFVCSGISLHIMYQS